MPGADDLRNSRFVQTQSEHPIYPHQPKLNGLEHLTAPEADFSPGQPMEGQKMSPLARALFQGSNCQTNDSFLGRLFQIDANSRRLLAAADVFVDFHIINYGWVF